MWMRWLFWVAFLTYGSQAWAARAKDVGFFAGLQGNTVTGAGLVTGLPRTGDSPRNEAAIRSLATRLQGYGVTFTEEELNSRNIAMVMVTATLPADARPGTQIDIKVTSTGDARSIEGAELLATPLYGMDGRIHVLAQGSVLVGGYSVGVAGNSVRKGIPTGGVVMGGGRVLIENEGPDYNEAQTVDFVLSDPDFTTAERLELAINEAFGASIARARSSSTIELAIPQEYMDRFAPFAARIEMVEVAMDSPARVVVDERTGTVVFGGNVQVAPVAVAHGGLTIQVQRVNSVSQPNAFSFGATEVVSNVYLEAGEARGELVAVEGVQIGDLVAALNRLGVTPRDLISILRSMKAQGALHAELVTQ